MDFFFKLEAELVEVRLMDISNGAQELRPTWTDVACQQRVITEDNRSGLEMWYTLKKINK